jgi:hypothetical protein
MCFFSSCFLECGDNMSFGSGDRRRRELIRVRQIYIPELIIQLHALLSHLGNGYSSTYRLPSRSTHQNPPTH